VHAHRATPTHDHDHRALLGIGMLHGLAGTGALVALPLVATSTPSRSVIFLVAFGLGTVVTMSLFGATAGWLLGATRQASPRWFRGAIVLAGLASTGVGIWWVLAGGA
jgi:sulfite exporter TauE/SafE